MGVLAERDLLVGEWDLMAVVLRTAPGWCLSSHSDVEGLESAGVALKSAPAWFLSSYLDVEGLASVWVALFLV